MAVLNEMQTLVVDTARDWARERMPVAAFRAVRDAADPRGFDAASWTETGELGWIGAALSEDHGGADLGYLTLGLIVEQTGRNIGATPLPVTAVAADAVATAGSPSLRAAWLERLVSGEAVGAFAIDEGARHDPQGITATAERTPEGWRLSGTKRFVAEGMGADLLIVAARADDGVGLFAVEASAEGVSRSPRRLTDFRGHADIVLDGATVAAEARLAAPEGDATLIEALLDRLRALAAAELLGLSSSAFEQTLEYLKTRVQFGQTIGSFQALQHRAAELFTRLELTRSAVEAALSAIDANSPERPALVALAKASAGDTANLATREMIQLHGGIGMTDEHDAGFYIKRSRVLEAAWGSAAFHRDRYGRLLGV